MASMRPIIQLNFDHEVVSAHVLRIVGADFDHSRQFIECDEVWSGRSVCCFKNVSPRSTVYVWVCKGYSVLELVVGDDVFVVPNLISHIALRLPNNSCLLARVHHVDSDLLRKVSRVLRRCWCNLCIHLDDVLTCVGQQWIQGEFSRNRCCHK